MKASTREGSRSAPPGPVFCAGSRGGQPEYDGPCPMYRKVPRARWQPLVMTGEPDKLVGNAVGYRCRVCRQAFCASCALVHFGLDKHPAALQVEVARVQVEFGIRGGWLDDLVVARAKALGMTGEREATNHHPECARPKPHTGQCEDKDKRVLWGWPNRG